MNISKVNDFIKMIGLFLYSNLTGILFLVGISTIVYAFFRISTNIGLFSAGGSLIIISLILAKEGG